MAIRSWRWVFAAALVLASAGLPGLGGQALAGNDLYAPVQPRYSCTTVPGGTTTQRVCDSRGVCRLVQVQGESRRVCTQTNR